MEVELAKAVNDFSSEVSLLRQSKGTYNEFGKWEDQDPKEIKINACVQPINGKDLVKVPEGFRTRSIITLYTTNEVRTASEVEKTQADIVTWNGERYQIYFIEKWPEYTKAIAVKIERDD